MEKFFTQIEIENRPEESKILLLKFLRQKGLTKRFEMNYRELIKEKRKKFSKDENYYLNQFNLDNEFYYFNFGNFRAENVSYLQSKSDNLDYFFIFSKLHTFNEMFHMEGRKNKDSFYKKNFLEEIVSFVEKNIKTIKQIHPNIFIIYLVFMMFEKLDDKYLNELLNYLNVYDKKFAKDKISYYYHYVTQYYIQKINLGGAIYRESVFKIYEFMKEKRLFLIDNIITDLEYNNVCNVSLALKKYNWLDEFIEEYKKHLDPDFKKDAYNLAKAKLAFHKKDYENVFKFLSEVEFNDPNYYLNSKILLARIYYEMNNINGIFYILDNLKQYLRIKKNLTQEQNDAIKMFIKYIVELLKIKEKAKKEKKTCLVILRKELDNEKKFVPIKNWFYEKIADISP